MNRVTIPWVMKRLSGAYGAQRRKPVLPPIDELIKTVLSQNTSDVNSDRAYANLKSAFPAWEHVLAAKEAAIAREIASGGLGNIKSARIKQALAEIKDKQGDLDLRFLKDMPLDDARAWLERLPGIGAKTAACVLLFSLGMPALPVDTHVLRVSKRLGLVPRTASAEQGQRLLEATVPAKSVYQFHLLLIRHGRETCKALRPLCRECALNSRCPSALAFE